MNFYKAHQRHRNAFTKHITKCIWRDLSDVVLICISSHLWMLNANCVQWMQSDREFGICFNLEAEQCARHERKHQVETFAMEVAINLQFTTGMYLFSHRKYNLHSSCTRHSNKKKLKLSQCMWCHIRYWSNEPWTCSMNTMRYHQSPRTATAEYWSNYELNTVSFFIALALRTDSIIYSRIAIDTYVRWKCSLRTLIYRLSV